MVFLKENMINELEDRDERDFRKYGNIIYGKGGIFLK